jgi:hypothetical protein
VNDIIDGDLIVSLDSGVVVVTLPLGRGRIMLPPAQAMDLAKLLVKKVDESMNFNRKERRERRGKKGK